jgi:hypothetical protein
MEKLNRLAGETEDDGGINGPLLKLWRHANLRSLKFFEAAMLD